MFRLLFFLLSFACPDGAMAASSTTLSQFSDSEASFDGLSISEKKPWRGLPPELRFKIYDYFLKPRLITFNSWRNPITLDKLQEGNPSCLAYTCRETRQRLLRRHTPIRIIVPDSKNARPWLYKFGRKNWFHHLVLYVDFSSDVFHFKITATASPRMNLTDQFLYIHKAENLLLNSTRIPRLQRTVLIEADMRTHKIWIERHSLIEWYQIRRFKLIRSHLEPSLFDWMLPGMEYDDFDRRQEFEAYEDWLRKIHERHGWAPEIEGCSAYTVRDVVHYDVLYILGGAQMIIRPRRARTHE